MYDIGRSLDNQILEVMKNRPAVIMTEALEPRIIEAACFLPRFVRPIFLADESEVKEVIHRELGHLDPTRVEFALSESTFINPDKRTDLIEEFAKACVDLPDDISRTKDFDEAVQTIRTPARFGIMAVRQGHADIVVGGVTHEPREYFRPMARLLAQQDVLCEAGVFVLPDSHPQGIFPHNIVVMGDVGLNATMTPDVMAHVAVGTCAVARDIFPRGRAAGDQRRHRLLLQQGLGRGSRTGAGATGQRTDSRHPGRTDPHGQPLPEHQHRE